MSTNKTHSKKASTKALTTYEISCWTKVGILSAVALLLSYIETFLPLPLPIAGAKLGLSNIAILIALVQLDLRYAFGVAVIKILASGLLFGSPFTLLFSLTGTLLAFLAMALLTRFKNVSVVLVSIVGAILHNIGQLIAAQTVLGTAIVWVNAPWLIIVACITGAITGFIANYVVKTVQSNAKNNQNSSSSSRNSKGHNSKERI